MSIKISEEFLDLHASEFLSDHSTIEELYSIKRLNTVKTRSVARNMKKATEKNLPENHYKNFMIVLYHLSKHL